MKPTRLYYGITGVDGGELKLISVSMDSGRMDYCDVTDWSGFQSMPGTVLIEIEGNSQAMVRFFIDASKVNWLIEMPNDMTFMFEGYIESMEQSLGMGFGNSSATAKIRIAGPITAYYDGVVAPTVADTSDVFSRKASRAQAQVMADVLRKVCPTESFAL